MEHAHQAVQAPTRSQDLNDTPAHHHFQIRDHETDRNHHLYSHHGHQRDHQALCQLSLHTVPLNAGPLFDVDVIESQSE